MKRKLAVLASSIVVLAGCGAGPEEAPAEPSSPEPPRVQKAGSAPGSVEELPAAGVKVLTAWTESPATTYDYPVRYETEQIDLVYRIVEVKGVCILETFSYKPGLTSVPVPCVA